MTRRWKKIGKVGRAHGLQGAFYVGGRANLLPNVYREVIVGRDPESGIVTEIASYRVQNERALLTVMAFPDRNALEAHTGANLWAPHDAEGEHDYSALVGRRVLDCNDQPLGLVREFYNHGASDTVEIAAENGKSLEIPFVEAYFHWSFQSDNDDTPLRLKVEAALFADLWTAS